MKKEEASKYHPVIDNLRKIMKDKNLTQVTIANYAGIIPSQMSKVFSGQVGISIQQLENIATCLNMRIIDIFTYPEKYMPAESFESENITASITIQLKKEKKDQVLKLVFGDDNLKLLKE